jgi:hypothetical protein
VSDGVLSTEKTIMISQVSGDLHELWRSTLIGFVFGAVCRSGSSSVFALFKVITEHNHRRYLSSTLVNPSQSCLSVLSYSLKIVSLMKTKSSSLITSMKLLR